MSAYIVDKKEIDFLVEFIITHCVCTRVMQTFDEIMSGKEVTPEMVGQCLLDENYASVNHRSSESEEPYRYTFQSAHKDKRVRRDQWGNMGYSMLAALYDEHGGQKEYFTKVAGCVRHYKYQACEHPGWRASAANQMMAGILSAIVLALLPNQPFGL